MLIAPRHVRHWMTLLSFHLQGCQSCGCTMYLPMRTSHASITAMKNKKSLQQTRTCVQLTDCKCMYPDSGRPEDLSASGCAHSQRDGIRKAGFRGIKWATCATGTLVAGVGAECPPCMNFRHDTSCCIQYANGIVPPASKRRSAISTSIKTGCFFPTGGVPLETHCVQGKAPCRHQQYATETVP